MMGHRFVAYTTDRACRADGSLASDRFDGCCIAESRAAESRMQMETEAVAHSVSAHFHWDFVEKMGPADRWAAVAASCGDCRCCHCHRCRRRPMSGLAEILVDCSRADSGCQGSRSDCRIFDCDRVAGRCNRSADSD